MKHRCETCTRKNCADRTDATAGRTLLLCADYTDKKETNADRIRAMTDEELADMCVRYDPVRDMYLSNVGAHYDFVSAMEAEMEWLKQPAEDDNG